MLIGGHAILNGVFGVNLIGKVPFEQVLEYGEGSRHRGI